MTINSSITSKCPFKEVMISRFSDCHMVKKGTNWYILDSNMSLIEALSFKKPTVINKQGYFVAKIDENSDTKRYIEDFSKSSFYVCRIKDGNIGVAYPLTGVKSVDISEDEPLLILMQEAQKYCTILKQQKITMGLSAVSFHLMLMGRQLLICLQR